MPMDHCETFDHESASLISTGGGSDFMDLDIGAPVVVGFGYEWHSTRVRVFRNRITGGV